MGILDMTFRSREEGYFAAWCEELKELGYIKRWAYEEAHWVLADGMKFKRQKFLKTKSIIEDRDLIQPHEYGCDFIIEFEEEARHLFYDRAEGLVQNVKVPLLSYGFDGLVYVEIKAEFDRTNTIPAFKINQKWVFRRYGDYVNLVIPIAKTGNSLFRRTFTPELVKAQETYTRTGKTKGKSYRKGESKLKYKPVRTVEEYLLEVRKRGEVEGWLNIFKLNKFK